jgi:inward rectifier potassium channel
VSLYHSALVLRWPAFLGWVAAVYLGINLVFAGAFLACGTGALSGPGVGTMGGPVARAFFFSVETFATIGYGHVVPSGVVPNLLVTVEAFVGLLAQALITGLLFARFARPTAAVRFSRSAVIAPFREGQALMVRMANRRKNELIELTATMTFSYMELVNATPVRRYRPLALDRSTVTFFPLAWTIVHPITTESPLWGLTAEQLVEREAEFLLLLSGVDDTFAATVHARTSYRAEQVVWNARFANIFSAPDDRGVLSVDISRLDDVNPAS